MVKYTEKKDKAADKALMLGLNKKDKAKFKKADEAHEAKKTPKTMAEDKKIDKKIIKKIKKK